MKLIKKLPFSLIATLLFISCSTGDDSGITPDNPLGDYDNGILIINEGPFGTGTGTVTFISEDYSTVDGKIFNDVNNTDLGNIVQSMGFNVDNAYIVVNNSHKIEVVNRYTFEGISTITDGLDNPRHFVAVGNKGFVTNWGNPFNNNDDFIAVIDLATNVVIETISVDFGPERLLIKENELYVAHKGGFSQNNIITIINTNSNEVSTTLVVGDVPNSMVILNDDLWVICEGNPDYTGNETNGRLVKIDTNTNEVNQTFDFDITEHPSNLTINDSNLIYNLNGEVFSKEETSTSLPSTSILSGFFYSMTANNGKLYATDAGDFASNGILKVFDLSSNSEIQSIEVGIIPGGVYFND